MFCGPGLSVAGTEAVAGRRMRQRGNYETATRDVTPGGRDGGERADRAGRSDASDGVRPRGPRRLRAAIEPGLARSSNHGGRWKRRPRRRPRPDRQAASREPLAARRPPLRCQADPGSASRGTAFVEEHRLQVRHLLNLFPGRDQRRADVVCAGRSQQIPDLFGRLLHPPPADQNLEVREAGPPPSRRRSRKPTTGARRNVRRTGRAMGIRTACAT
jgi:hypothetical protein